MNNLDLIKVFLDSTNKQWDNIYENHIHKLNILHEIDITKSTITKYKYTKQKNNLKPEWYIMTHNNIYPDYENQNDELLLFIISNKLERNILFMFHISGYNILDNICVSNEITKFINNLTKNLSGIDIINKISITPIQNLFIKNNFKFYYETIKLALLNKDLKKIFLINPKQIICIVNFIYKNKKLLIDEISIIDKQRGIELNNKLIIENDKKNIFNRLWKNLNMCIFYQNNENIISKYIKLYIGKIKTYTPVYSNYLCIIGYDIFMDNSYIIDTRKGYFEFKNIIDDKIYTIRNLEKNNLYNIIISTTQSNIIRCITNNIIKVIDFYNNVPKIVHVCSYSNNYHEILEIESIIIEFRPMDYCYRKHEKQIIIYIELFDNNNKIENIKEPYIIKVVRSGTFEKLYETKYCSNFDYCMSDFDKLLNNEKDIELMKKNIIYVS